MKLSGYAIAGLFLIAVMVAALLLPSQSLRNEPADDSGIRIVSLNPNITEILFALGVGDSIVGATDFCDYPPEAKAIPRIGGMGKPNIETILVMQPDLILGSNLQAYDATKKLQESGIALRQFKMERLEDVFSAIEAIGKEIGAETRAAELTAEMRANLEALAARYRDIPESERPRVFLEIGDSPLGTVGRTSFLNDVIECAGGVNVAGELEESYPRISAEAVIAWNPDVIVLGYMSESNLAAEQISRRIGWSEIAAVKNGRIIADISPDLLLRPGPRLVDGIAQLSQVLYPELQPGELKDKDKE